MKQKSSPEFGGRNSRDHPARISISEFQKDSNGRRDKAMTWRVRAGLEQLVDFGPKPNAIISINGFRGADGTICVTVVDGSNWQGY